MFSNVSIVVAVIVPSVIAVIGWVVISWLNSKLQKKQLRDSAKMKVYDELYRVKLGVDKVSVNLGLLLMKTAPPFLSMSFEVNKHKGDEIKANMEGLNIWREYSNRLSESTSLFVKEYIKLLNLSDMWMGVMPDLKVVKKILFGEQLSSLSNELWKFQNFILLQSIKEFYWQKWDIEKINDEAEKLGVKYNKIAVGYVDDYMTLVYNELVSDILGHKKEHRENFDNLDKLEKYHILTKEGLIEVRNKQKKNENENIQF